MPVLEDALERSMTLAAQMDSRGYGRSGTASRRERAVTGLFMLLGLVGLAVGVYAFLDGTAPRWLATPMMLVGVGLSLVALVTAGRRVQRVRYRPDRWRPAELLTAGCGVLTAVLAYRLVAWEPLVAFPPLVGLPPLTPLALGVVLVALLPAFLTPPPRLEGAR